MRCFGLLSFQAFELCRIGNVNCSHTSLTSPNTHTALRELPNTNLCLHRELLGTEKAPPLTDDSEEEEPEPFADEVEDDSDIPITAVVNHCYVLYHHHVTPEHITHLLVRISRPDTTGTHPAARGMSGPFWKDLDNSHYIRTPSHTVGYSLYLGTTSDDTICLSFLIPTHMFLMIFYLMLFITISPDLFHLKHSFSIYTYLCLPVTSVWISTLVSASSSVWLSQIRTLCAMRAQLRSWSQVLVRLPTRFRHSPVLSCITRPDPKRNSIFRLPLVSHMNPGRSTCNSQRTGIGEALMATARCQPSASPLSQALQVFNTLHLQHILRHLTFYLILLLNSQSRKKTSPIPIPKMIRIQLIPPTRKWISHRLCSF